jgi:hypothetical protein
MLVEGQVTCLHCGATRGTWVGPKGSAITGKGLRGAPPNDIDPDAPLRCSRCRGPVIIEGAEPVISGARLRRIQRMREQLGEIGRKRPRAA